MSGARNLDGLRTQALHCIEDAYIKGYEAAKQDIVAVGNKSEYERGLNDAWECAKKIATSDGLEYDDLEQIFGYRGYDLIFGNFSASEAIARIKEYEEAIAERNASPDGELHIGDEVYSLDESKRKTVTAIDGNTVIVLGASGKYGTFNISELHKTGRRFVIDEILKELKGE